MSWGPVVGQVGGWLTSLGITGTVAAGAAYALFRWSGAKWVERHLTLELASFKAAKDRELEQAKGEFQRETERLKAELERFADRAGKFHQHEYEVLPEAWGLLNRAYGAAGDAISQMQSQPDLEKLKPEELEEFFATSDLKESQKAEIRGTRDKNRVYGKIRSWHQIGSADSAAIAFANYVILNGVFIEDGIADKMQDAAKQLRTAILHRRFVEEGMGHEFWTQAVEALKPVEVLVLEIKTDVKRRLWAIQMPSAEVTTPPAM